MESIQITQVAEAPGPAVLGRDLPTACAWRREDLGPDSGRVRLTEAALAELRSLACDPMIYHGNVEDFAPDLSRLRETSGILATVRRQLDHGIGFAVLDRLPVEEWDERQSAAIAFLVTSALGPVVMQKSNGTRLYDVRDTGKALSYGVRRSITNLGQSFHTDGPWLERTPEVVGLTCLRQAETGGVSRVASLATVHNMLHERHPELLARLYRDFWWDRQAEHGPDEARGSRHPVFAWDDQRLSCRYYDDYVRKGHRMMGVPLDIMGELALDAMQEVIEAPEAWIEFRLEPGQVEYVNNRLLAHARTAFQDPGAPDAKRHLLRIWVRRSGGIALERATTLIQG